MKKTEIEVGKVYACSASRDYLSGWSNVQAALVLAPGYSRVGWLSDGKKPYRQGGREWLVLVKQTVYTGSAPNYTVADYESGAEVPPGWHLGTRPSQEIRTLFETYDKERTERVERQRLATIRARELRDKNDADALPIRKEFEARDWSPIGLDVQGRRVRLTFEQFTELVTKSD